MRLTDILTGMLFAKSAQGALFSDFESRKSHLHQETKVDKRGRITHRWVSNEQEAPKKPRAPRKPKPTADTQQPQLTLKLPRGVTQAQGTLFDGLLQPMTQQTMQIKPQPVQGGLFDAVQQAVKPVMQAKPRKPRKARKPADSHDTPITPATAVAELREAVTEANTDPTPENEQALRAAIKNNRLITGATDENTSHTAATNGDTPAPEGQQYLVGLPEGVKDRQRKQWNKAAEDLVMELRDHPRATTTEERQLLARYSGNGGIGASLNEYYTPPELGKAMWDVLGKLGSGKGKGLEPSSGPGVLAQFAGDDAHMDMVELSPISAGIANTLFGHRHDVHSMSFEAFRQRNPDSTYNFMVGNPPFGSRDENLFLDDKYQEIKECSRYFTLSSLDHLEEGGIATLVLPAGLARNKNDAEFRARVLARAEVMAIHGLPTDTFARAGTEMATTDVWVLRGRPTAVRPILDEGGTEALKAAGVHDEDFVNGKWHEAHPEQMHGTVTQRQGPMGAMVYARDGQLDEATLQGIVAQTPAAAPQQVPTAAELVEKLKDNPRAIAGYLKEQRGKEGDTRISATGQAQICYGGRWHNVHDDTPMALTQGKQLSVLLTMHAQTLSHGNYDQANNLREQLERLLTEYKAKYGNPHDNADLQRLAKDTPDLNNLLAAFQPDGSLSPSLSEDAQAPKIDVDLSDPASVLAHLRRKGQAATTEAYQAVTGKSSPDEAADHLIGHGFAYHPERGVWTAPGEFYSGDSNDVRDTIERGLSAEQPAWAKKALEAQRSELDKRVPVTPLSDFEVTPRDTWVPEEVLKSYLLSHTTGPLAMLTHQALHNNLREGPNGTYEVTNYTSDARKKKLLNFLKRYLTGQGARSDEANDYAELDEGFRDFLAANPNHREAVEEAYAARGAWLEPTWNTDPVDSQIEGWKGKDEGGVTLHSYQNEAIHRSLAQGGGVIALDVGLGKTPTAIAQCYLAKQKGLAKNPVAAVPKSVIGQWRQKALQAKPDARVLVVGAAPRLDKDGKIELDNEGREIWDDVSGAAALDRQLSQLKTGDYDLVLMTHTTLGRIQYDPMQQLQLIQDEFYSQGETTYGKATGMSGKLYQQYAGLKVQAMLNQGDITLEDLGKAQEQLKELDLELKEHYGSKSNLSPSEKKDKAKKKEERQRLSFLVAASRALAKEDAHPLKTQWDELGIDHLVIDEAHNFKGLWTYSKSRGDKNIKYLGAPAEPSQRAVDLYYKTKAMREAQGGRGVYLLTATPIKNSPVEIYNMLSYTAPSVFKRLGIHNLDQFVSRYCRIEEQPSIDPDTGELKYVSVLAGLKNLAELRRECARFVNRKTATQVGLPLPFNDEATEHIEPKTEQSDLIKWVAKNPVEAARKYLGADIPDEITEGDEEYDKMAQRYALAIPHITRRAELDMEMIDPVKYKGYVSPKVGALLDDLERTTKNGEKTVIFSDVVNMPNPGGDKANPHGYSFHEKLRQLIHERTGVPLEKIAIVNAQTCPDSEDRLKVSNGVKSGQYQIVIGNTGTMGEGINLQHGVANLLHLDVPWNPAVWQQRVGRVVRQGNKLGTVNNKTFLGTRGLDKDMFDTLKGKGVWYDEFWNGESDTMDTDGQNDYRMTPERLAALAIDDPDERAAELERINGGEKANREVAKRIAAVKQFHRLQSARKAQAEAEGVLFRAKEPTEKQRASVAALKASADALTEKLRSNPAFAPFVHHLDNPSVAIIDAGSGKSWQVGQKFSVANTDGTTTHVVLTNVNARKGFLQYNHLDLAGGEIGGAQNRKQVPISTWAEGETRPYDIHTHVRDFVSSGQVPNPYNNGEKVREVLNKHPEQVREGLRERDSWNPGPHDKRLIRRNGQVMKVTTDQLQEGDHYLINDGAQDTQDVQNWLKHPDTDTSDYYQGLGTALSQAQFEHKRDWPSNRIVAKAESTLSELYTQMRGK